MNKRIMIIGGGASGLMAAVWAARFGASVTILEHNEKPGKKLLASGNGKCNLTNRMLDPSQYQSDRPELVKKVLHAFSPEDTCRWFEKIGLRTFDRQGWVYPCTEQASSVLELLLWEAERQHVHFKNKEEVLAVSRGEDDPFLIRTKTWEYAADAVIIASGSPASAVRGSSDLARQLADSFRLPFRPFRPVLVPLQASDSALCVWNGTRVHAGVRLFIDGLPHREETGEVQLTSYGISGIPIFQLSRAVSAALDVQKQVTLLLDFLPEVSENELEELWRERELYDSTKPYGLLLAGLLPERLIPVVLAAAGLKKNIRPSMEDHDENGAVHILLQLLKEFPVRIRKTASPEQAQICSGGICLSALQDSLCCRTVPGLYAAGEAVNVDGPCGGYNLQWAWSSGFVAGRAAAGGN